jgi:hypothetical protein
VLHIQDWSRIGEVKVKDSNGNEEVFASLRAAVRRVGWYKIKGCTGRDLPTPIPYYDGREWRQRWIAGDPVVFLDEMGLRIPLGLVVSTALALGLDVEGYQRWYWRRRRVFRFRNGPVPGTRCWRGGGGGWIRDKLHTVQEIRETQFHDEFDEDRDEIWVRRKRLNIPTAWDDLRRHTERNWKSQRRTQWR